MSPTKGRLIRVSNDTMKKLKNLGEPFESPNECLNRILSNDPCLAKRQEEKDGQNIDEEDSEE